MTKIPPKAVDLAIEQFGKEKNASEKRRKKVAAYKEKRAKGRNEWTKGLNEFLVEHPEFREVYKIDKPKKKTKKKKIKSVRLVRGTRKSTRNRR